MATYQTENKRIAKNTIIVYANMFIGMIIGLYTSRLVLQALGVSDYGLYNVVGGIVAMFLFISGSLSTTTTRYINVEMGKPEGNLNKIFNVCNVLHICLALILLILAEILGVWYIHNYLNVAPGKEGDAMFVYQYSVIISCIGITNVPYASLFNATEKFLFNAIVSVGLKILQLALVIWLVYYSGNKIRAYTIMMSLSTFITFAIYHYYSIRYWPKVIKWKIVKDWKIYKEALIFNNYNLMYTSAIMGRSQGANLLINYFFNTAVNGAFAIAKTVEGYVMIFSSNFDGAAAPQISQNFSSGNMDRVLSIVCKVGKYSILLMMIAFFPLFAEIDLVLKLWLGTVPDGAVDFCKLTLIIALVSSTCGGIVHVINASGKIAKFKTTFSIMMLSCLPIGYLMFKYGKYEPYMLIVLFAIVDIIWRITQLYYLRILLDFNVITFIKEAYIRPLIIFIIMSVIIIVSSQIELNTFLFHFLRLISILLITIITTYFIGLTSNEKDRLFSFAKDKIKSIK